MYKKHGNEELLKIAPSQCKQLKTVEVQFCQQDKASPRVLKYLQDGVDKLRARINMSTFPLEYFGVMELGQMLPALRFGSHG